MKQVFIINGAAGVGKDSFVYQVTASLRENILKEGAPYHPPVVKNYSSVDRIKEIAKIIGWDGTKDEKSRRLLSDLKSICADYNDLPFNTIIDEYAKFIKDPNLMILFLHIREPLEIERAKIAFNAKTVLIVRDSVEQITSNASDASVFDYEYDIIINNNEDMKALIRIANTFVNDLKDNRLNFEY